MFIWERFGRAIPLYGSWTRTILQTELALMRLGRPCEG